MVISATKHGKFLLNMIKPGLYQKPMTSSIDRWRSEYKGEMVETAIDWGNIGWGQRHDDMQ